MYNLLMNFLVLRIERLLRRMNRFICISGTEDKQNVYLVRYFLFRSRWFSIYIHRFLRSDRDDHHDHPFSFLSYVVKGRYDESLLTGGMPGVLKKDTVYLPEFTKGAREQGTWGYRKAEAIHMVQLDREYSLDQIEEAPLTVIFRGPYRREWGFWKRQLRGVDRIQWVYWREYLGIPEGDARE